MAIPDRIGLALQKFRRIFSHNSFASAGYSAFAVMRAGRLFARLNFFGR
jgi:hypothetical protein